MAVHRLGSIQLARAPYLVIPKDIFSSRTKGEKFTFHLAFYRLRRRRDRWRKKGFFFLFLTALLGFRIQNYTKTFTKKI